MFLNSRRVLFGLLSLLVISAASGCATRGDIADVMLPYTVLRKVVIAQVPGGVREQSANGREIKSQYFTPKGLDEVLEPEDAVLAIDRAYAEVVILGASRPFQIMARVYRERKEPGAKAHRLLGVDKRLTEDLQTRLNQALADRREGSNIIDGFRAF